MGIQYSQYRFIETRPGIIFGRVICPIPPLLPYDDPSRPKTFKRSSSGLPSIQIFTPRTFTFRGLVGGDDKTPSLMAGPLLFIPGRGTARFSVIGRLSIGYLGVCF